MLDRDSILQIIGHLANVLYLVGFALRDVIWLRTMFIAGSIIEIIYSYYIAEQPLWVNILWCGLYLGVNSIKVVLFLVDHFTLKLNPDEEILYTRLFRRTDRMSFKKLLENAQWVDIGTNKVIVEQGEKFEKIAILHDGVAEVEVDGITVALLRNDNFIGEMSFLSGELTSARVRTLSPCRLVEWEKADLHDLMQRDDKLRLIILEVFNLDMMAKIVEQNNAKREIGMTKSRLTPAFPDPVAARGDAGSAPL
jgi:hypothetical protein